MSEPLPDNPSPGIDPLDILAAVFRHKWKIILCGLLGIAGGAAVLMLHPVAFRSEAKLLVRYVVERSAIDPIENPVRTMGPQAETMIGSEVEMLTSWDLLHDVAEKVGVHRILPGLEEKASLAGAVHSMLKTLHVSPIKNTNVIMVSYEHQDPQVATDVLQNLINGYLAKHLEVHRSLGAFEFASQQTDEIRSRLNTTENALRKILGELGITSFSETVTSLNASKARLETDLSAVEAEFANQKAVVGELERGAGPRVSGAESGEPAAVSAEDQIRYESLVASLTRLREEELELLSRFRPESQVVRQHREQVATLDKQRRELEARYGRISARPAAAPGAPASSTSADITMERARLAGVEARLNVLKGRLASMEQMMQRLREAEPDIITLERRRALDSESYQALAASLEKARVDEALDPSRMPNISVVQRPSAPSRAIGQLKKLVLAIVGGAFAFGVGLAVAIDLFLSPTIRRPAGFEKRLGVPLLLAIPFLSKRRGRSEALPPGEKGKEDEGGVGRPPGAAVPWDFDHFIRPFCEAIRDKLSIYFDINGITHKPKLVALTGCSAGAGTSTLAAGLAATLSETGDGKVLLVDMNQGAPAAHRFFHGVPEHSIEEALQGRRERVEGTEKLYLARSPRSGSSRSNFTPGKMMDIVPQMRASDFDYIIFDLPPLGQTSPTPAIARFMDKVLLIVEAGKTRPGAVIDAHQELTHSRSKVAVLLNKWRNDLPRWIGG
jgi:uncharacterized protein involved in exopolysaccharide biosynthesis/Mrp family chromosome partitioning ATPase